MLHYYHLLALLDHALESEQHGRPSAPETPLEAVNASAMHLQGSYCCVLTLNGRGQCCDVPFRWRPNLLLSTNSLCTVVDCMTRQATTHPDI